MYGGHPLRHSYQTQQRRQRPRNNDIILAQRMSAALPAWTKLVLALLHASLSWGDAGAP